jgi:hypothetical protein
MIKVEMLNNEAIAPVVDDNLDLEIYTPRDFTIGSEETYILNLDYKISFNTDKYQLILRYSNPFLSMVLSPDLDDEKGASITIYNSARLRNGLLRGNVVAKAFLVKKEDPSFELIPYKSKDKPVLIENIEKLPVVINQAMRFCYSMARYVMANDDVMLSHELPQEEMKSEDRICAFTFSKLDFRHPAQALGFILFSKDFTLGDQVKVFRPPCLKDDKRVSDEFLYALAHLYSTYNFLCLGGVNKGVEQLNVVKWLDKQQNLLDKGLGEDIGDKISLGEYKLLVERDSLSQLMKRVDTILKS